MLTGVTSNYEDCSSFQGATSSLGVGQMHILSNPLNSA